MKRLLLLFCLLTQIIKPSDKIVVGYYYADYTSYSHKVIDYRKLTHIAHAFVRPNLDGSIGTDSWFFYPDLITAAHNNGVKIVVSVGGWGNSDNFSPVCADATLRQKFVNNLVNFCTTNGYDGADIDWEYPTSSDKANFVSLITEMREAFNLAGLEFIAAALPSTDWNGGFDIASLKDKLDWFGIMTYDFYGTWETNSGHNSPLYSSTKQYYSTNVCINQYIAAGIPRDKLCIGMAFYGYNFKTAGLYSTITQSESVSISYTSANAKKVSAGWQYFWDDVCKVPYLQDPAKTRIITYDDSTSIKLKCEYIRKNNLAGTIIWKIGLDYSASNTPLLNMIGKYLLNSPVTVPLVPNTNLPAEGSTEDYTSVQFTWQPTDSTTSYNLQIDTTYTFYNPVLYKKGINLTYFTKTNLQQNKTYYWRVSSSNIAGTGEWSEIKSFKTNGQSTFVQSENIIPDKLELSNYPNPFNPVTKIRYTISGSKLSQKNSFVSLKVYDVLGNDVVTLVNEEQKPGEYEVVFSAVDTGRISSLTSGIYFYRLSVDNNIITKKMCLIK